MLRYKSHKQAFIMTVLVILLCLVCDFVVKEDTEYEFVTGTYFVVIEGETDRYFVLDVNVSGETITVSNVKDISEYFV